MGGVNMGSPESRGKQEDESMRKNGNRCHFSAAGGQKQIIYEGKANAPIMCCSGQ
jgi:hypothetical protein